MLTLSTDIDTIPRYWHELHTLTFTLMRRRRSWQALVDDQVEEGRDTAEARVQEESLVPRTEDCVVVPAPPYVPVPGTYRVGWPRTARKISFLATNVRSRRWRRKAGGGDFSLLMNTITWEVVPPHFRCSLSYRKLNLKCNFSFISPGSFVDPVTILWEGGDFSLLTKPLHGRWCLLTFDAFIPTENWI